MDTLQPKLTQGSIVKSLTLFALPYLAANFIQALYGAVDLAIVGWFTDAAGISAVSIGTQVMQIVTSLVSGLTLGGTVLIAQYFGARREQDVRHTISTMLGMFAAAAGAFTLIMCLACGGILSLLQTPAQAFTQAYQYVLICSLGILFIFGYNAISAVLRGVGDSKSPMLFVGIACVCNIVLDLLLVGPLHMGAAGAALATVASQAVSMVIAIVYLRRRAFLFDFKLKSLRIHREQATRLLKLGLPISLQESLVHLSFMIITAIVNNMGVIASAAVGVAGKFEGFAMLPATAFAAAISAMVAQNMGAGEKGRAEKTLYAGIAIAFGCSVLFFIWAQVAPVSILAIFKADALVSQAGAQYLRSFSYDFMLVAFVFCMNGFFNGCGRTTFSMVNGLLSTFLVRVPLALLFSNLWPASLTGIGLAAPLASFVSIVVGFVYIRTRRWMRGSIGAVPDETA
ncbi:Staphylococcal virulence regulator protein A [uncultured Clostridium sp.]|nr:Staphylococcal virulence regulator protein A [uncultured Clostridium sp.]